MTQQTSLKRFWEILKLRQTLFSLWWRVFLCVYFCAGAGALLLLFVVEARFFSEFTKNVTLGFAIAGLLEFTKMGISIIRKALTVAERMVSIDVSPNIAWLTTTFQIGLIVISLFCCMVTISSSLYEEMASLETSFQHQSLIRTIESATKVAKEGLGLEMKPVTLIGIFSLLASILLQLTSFLIFMHVAAIQSEDIEHLFEMKMSRMRVKTRLQNQFFKDQQSKDKILTAKEESLKRIDELTKKLLTDLESHRQ